jgi:putative phosphoesterase
MDVAIISDTHIPSRARRLPPDVRERIRRSDHVIHAGDFDSESAYSDIDHLASNLTAVAGNTDPRIGLPSVVSVELDGVEFVVTHGTGPHRGYEQRVADAVRAEAETDDPVGVAGHTHEVLDTTRDGVRILNPGSATGARPATRTTMLSAEVSNGDLDVRLQEW